MDSCNQISTDTDINSEGEMDEEDSDEDDDDQYVTDITKRKGKRKYIKTTGKKVLRMSFFHKRPLIPCVNFSYICSSSSRKTK